MAATEEVAFRLSKWSWNYGSPLKGIPENSQELLEWKVNYDKARARHLDSWRSYIADASLLDSVVLPLVRKGVPQDLRADVWSAMTEVTCGDEYERLQGVEAEDVEGDIAKVLS